VNPAGERARIVAIVAFAFVLRAGFAWVLPPFQAPDERAHLAYVRTLAIDHALPVQPDLAPGEALSSWPQSYQPPLAYVLFAPVAAASHALGAGRVGMLRALRLQNALYGSLLVIVVFALAAALRPPGDPLRLLAPLLTATLPGLAANAGSLNNDGLANLAAAGFWWVWLRQPPGPARGVALGCALGLACLAKLTAATLLPLWLLLPWLEGRSLRDAALEAAAAGATWLFLLLPWMVRNANVYGDPLAIGVGSFSFERLAAAGLPADFVQEAARPDPGKALLQAFGRFGITNNLSPALVTWAWIPLAALGIAGWLRGAAGHAPERRRVTALLCGVALVVTGLVAFSLRYYGAWQGRYLYVGIAPLALLGAEGIARWIRPLPPARARRGVTALALALAAVAVATLVTLAVFFAATPSAEWGLRTWL
jgi:hypothetical protein